MTILLCRLGFHRQGLVSYIPGVEVYWRRVYCTRCPKWKTAIMGRREDHETNLRRIESDLRAGRVFVGECPGCGVTVVGSQWCIGCRSALEEVA